MRLKTPILIILSTLFILSCTNISEETAEIIEDYCFNVSCWDNEHCFNGNCICNDNYKKCNNICILEAGCCNDNDCGETETCINNKCVFSCKKMLCPYNQVCDKDLKECVCNQDSFWCEYQKRCIKIGLCCDSYDCSTNKKCTKTTFSVGVCTETPQKTCKYVSENKFITFDIDGDRYKFELEKVYSNNEIQYYLNGELLRSLKMNEKIELKSGVYLYFNEIKEIGGLCKY